MGMVALSASIIAGVSALGVAVWVCFAMARVEEELLSFAGFEGMHLQG